MAIIEEAQQHSPEPKSLVAYCLEESADNSLHQLRTAMQQPAQLPTAQQVQDHPYIRDTGSTYTPSSRSATTYQSRPGRRDPGPDGINYNGKYSFRGVLEGDGRVYCLDCRESFNSCHRGMKNEHKDIASHMSKHEPDARSRPRQGPRLCGFDWSFAPMRRFDDRFARQNRCESPRETKAEEKTTTA
ncbi:hypothetical protein PG984_016213 [Apiospora sp. TS-2023a]